MVLSLKISLELFAHSWRYWPHTPLLEQDCVLVGFMQYNKLKPDRTCQLAKPLASTRARFFRSRQRA